MQQMDRLHPLIDKEMSLTEKKFIFLHSNSFIRFFIAITNCIKKKSVKFMQQMDRLHPLIDKEMSLTEKKFIFLHSNSFIRFFIAITNCITNL